MVEILSGFLRKELCQDIKGNFVEWEIKKKMEKWKIEANTGIFDLLRKVKSNIMKKKIKTWTNTHGMNNPWYVYNN